MSFSIRFLSEPVPNLEPGERARMGLITVDMFQEKFIASLDYWGAADYERQWEQGIFRIIRSSGTSCLITSMHDPASANFITWWPMYRVDNTVFIQNQILFLDSLPHQFAPNDPYSSIPERETVSEDGEIISEWSISADDLKSFLQQKPR